MNFRLNLKYILAILFVIECICVTYSLKFPLIIPITTIIYFIVGVTISILILNIRATVDLTTFSQIKPVNISVYKFLVTIGLAICMYHFTNELINQNPLSYYDADMLPIMKIMSSRFLNGNWSMVYKPIPEIWNGIQPIYLPGMWMPFIISVKFDFDPRWITTICTFASFLIFLKFWEPNQNKKIAPLLMVGAGILLWWIETEKTNNFLRLSEEGIIVFYYSLLVIALYTEKYIFIGIVASLCLLSRYFLIGWFPAMIIYLIMNSKNATQVIKFCVSSACIFLLLVVIPFGLEPIKIVLALPNNYISHASRVWNESPQFFYRSMGFAKFFGPTHVKLLHTFLMLLAFIAPSLFIVVCHVWANKKNRQLMNIPLACLKFTIVIVCTFIDVPYQYLFYTSSFISLLMITIALRGQSESTLYFRNIKSTKN